MANRLWCFLMAAMAMAAPTAWSQTSQDYQSRMSGWEVTCNNLRDCVVIGTATGEFFIRIVLPNNQQKSAQVFLHAWFEKVKAPAGGRLRVVFEGSARPAAAGVHSARKDDDYLVATLESPVAQRFLQDAAKSGSINVTLDGAVRAAPLRMPLASLDAALRHVAAMQKKPQVRRSIKRAGSAQPVPALPGPQVADLLEKTCDDGDPKDSSKSRGFRLSGDTLLWELHCIKAPYNTSHVFVVEEAGKGARVLAPEIFSGGAFKSGEPFVLNAQFDPQTMTLRFANLGRGLGDCGWRGTYVWDGAAFRMVELFGHEACKGVQSMYWPNIWQAEVQ